MEHGRFYLMGECEAMASGRERSPTILTPTLAPSSCHRKQASLGANDKISPGLQLQHAFRGDYREADGFDGHRLPSECNFDRTSYGLANAPPIRLIAGIPFQSGA
jgi:hypothetical protein